MTAISKTVLCDTNVIVRYLLGQDENQKLVEQAKEIFDRVKTGNMRIVILESVFTECIHVLFKMYKIPKSILTENLIGLLQYKGVINEDKQDLILALRLFERANLHIVDCLLAIKSDTLDMA